MTVDVPDDHPPPSSIVHVNALLNKLKEVKYFKIVNFLATNFVKMCVINSTEPSHCWELIYKFIRFGIL